MRTITTPISGNPQGTLVTRRVRQNLIFTNTTDVNLYVYFGDKTPSTTQFSLVVFAGTTSQTLEHMHEAVVVAWAAGAPTSGAAALVEVLS